MILAPTEREALETERDALVQRIALLDPAESQELAAIDAEAAGALRDFNARMAGLSAKAAVLVASAGIQRGPVIEVRPGDNMRAAQAKADEYRAILSERKTAHDAFAATVARLQRKVSEVREREAQQWAELTARLATVDAAIESDQEARLWLALRCRR